MRRSLLLLGIFLLALGVAGHGDASAEEPAPATTSSAGAEVPAATTAAVATTTGESEANAKGSVAPKKRAAWHDRPGGINPCMTPDPGFGIYDTWSRKVTMGQLLAPQKGGVSPSGAFDLIVHFHGHEPVRKEFVKSANGIVLVGIDLGIGSGAYSSAFAAPQAFERLLESVKQEMARRSGKPNVKLRHLALSSWSAGYGAVQQILAQPAGKMVDSVILLDSLHAGYVDGGHQVSPSGLDPFVAFARDAARGKRFMYQSFSSIVPPGYASTREVAHFLVGQLGGRFKTTKRADVLGLAMDERFDQGNYHVRGYLGDDKPDHCAHLGLMKDVVKAHLNRRWNPPRGARVKPARSTTSTNDAPKPRAGSVKPPKKKGARPNAAKSAAPN